MRTDESIWLIGGNICCNLVGIKALVAVHLFWSIDGKSSVFFFFCLITMLRTPVGQYKYICNPIDMLILWLAHTLVGAWTCACVYMSVCACPPRVVLDIMWHRHRPIWLARLRVNFTVCTSYKIRSFHTFSFRTYVTSVTIYFIIAIPSN